MLDLESIENALVSWIRLVTGISQANVILADQNAPVPATGLYLTLKIGPIDRVARDQYGATQLAGTRRLLGNRQMPVTIVAYRKGGRAALELLATSLDMESFATTLRTAGVIVYDAGQILNLTTSVESTIREQFVLELFVRTGVESVEVLPTGGYIAQAEVTETIEQPPMADFEQTVIIGDAP